MFDALVLASPAALIALQALLTEKNGKAYIRCQIRDKDVLAKPEELLRQVWVYKLIYEYGYPRQRIAVEYPITFGRDSSKRADIVVFDADRPTVAFIIFELKQGTLKGGKEQLRSYTHATGAPLAVWSNGTQFVVWHRKNPNYFIEIPELPTVGQTIDDIAGQPWTIQTLIDKEHQREAEGQKARSLRELIEDMEDEVLANAGVDVFEEVFKLIFTKLYDELACHRGRYKYLRFRNTNTTAQLKNSMQNLFDEAKKEWEGVFAPDERIRLNPDHLSVCIGSLEEWKLFNSNLDVVDEAFEYLVNKSSKGEKGQYFTPRWVIDLCVKMMNPKEYETVIDTACGSAGFTVHAIFHVWKQILESEGLSASHLFTLEDKPQRCKDYVHGKVFAIDFDEKSVRVARCLNLIAGDGQTNVLHLNTLDWTKWDETAKQDDWRDTYGVGWTKFRRQQTDKKGYRNFGFDVLMANPPFAGDIKQSDMLAPYELGHKGNGKLETKVGRDLLFIERNLDFLKPGGRMAIVLPQGRFNNSSDKRVREFIAEHCRILAVVGLHPNTFKPHTGTKTSVLFVQKWNDDPTVGNMCPRTDDYNIFFATQKLPSKDNSGDKIYVTRKKISYFEEGKLIWFDEDDFLAKYGSIDRATLYKIPSYGERNLEEIKAKYGNTDIELSLTLKNAINLKMPVTRTERLRDSHGHYVVQHDFFNHDGLTQDGIAEAFEEFSKKEKLSFFESPPPSLYKGESEAGGFDEIRYHALLQSLEITDISFSLFKKHNAVFRFDSEYFAPRVADLLKQLNQDGLSIQDVAPPRHQRFIPKQSGEFKYIEISGLSADGTAEAETIPQDEAPSRATWHVKSNDVISSMVRPLRRLSALISEQQNDFVCSSGFVVLEPKSILPEVLLTYLRLPIICELMDLHTSASMYPAISEQDLLAIPIPKFGQAFEKNIADTVKKAYNLRNDAGLFIARAEQTLLRALGLENWQPPEPLTYTRTSQEAFSAGRFDAEYFYPAKKAAQDFLSSMTGQRIGDLFDSVRELWQPELAAIDEQVRNYDLTDALNPFLDDAKLPTTRESIESTKKIIQKGDLVVSRLRSYLKEIAVVLDTGDIPMVCSTEFIVLRPKSNTIQVEALMIYLRSLLPQTIFKWSQDGSNHPRFDEKELLNLRIPDKFIEHEIEITNKVQTAINCRRQARDLLNAAKRAVEIAIESSEHEAIQYLEYMTAPSRPE